MQRSFWPRVGDRPPLASSALPPKAGERIERPQHTLAEFAAKRDEVDLPKTYADLPDPKWRAISASR